jgi:hypothetical protein
MKARVFAFVAITLLFLSYGSMGWCEPPPENAPQTSVVCTGWHALCDAAADCQVIGGQAYCDCWAVDEQHVVETSKIQDPELLRETQRRCTTGDPCDVDEAPVCAAIQDGTFTVDNVAYQWVSTYSYLAWCTTFRPSPSPCTGEWADCMSAPCTEISDPDDPARPLSCQCRLQEPEGDRNTFVGINGTCSPNGPTEVMSTIASRLWDFEKQTYRIPPPGYEYVSGACAPPP